MFSFCEFVKSCSLIYSFGLQRYYELSNEYDEFQKCSKEYEKELELHLKLYDEKNKDICLQNLRLSNENDRLKVI